MNDSRRKVSEVEGFINMLLAASEDKYMNKTLEVLLSKPDEERKIIVVKMVEELKAKRAPQTLIEAIACLVDDSIAEKAYEVIYQRGR